MSKINIVKIILFLSICGVLFAGYLSYSSLFRGICPLNEGCPILFGYPICVYGFVLFLSITIVSLTYLIHKKYQEIKENILILISSIGVGFSLYYSYYDLFLLKCLNGKCSYSLLIPSCIYGAIIYILISFLAFKLKKHKE